MRSRELRVIGIKSLPAIQLGDDLTRLILQALRKQHLWLLDGDALVLSQKIVSKAQGRLIRLDGISPSKRASQIALRTGRDPRLVHAILNESSEILRADRDALVVCTKSGIVCLNAGLDRSNVEGDATYTLLPSDPDAEASRIRKEIWRLTGKSLAVLICDTFSRPFRSGQVEFAIGLAGLNPIDDYRGSRDLYGYKLRFKFVCIADELACAAELVMGQGDEGTPAALIRGFLEKSEPGSDGCRMLRIPKRIDLYRGTV